MRNFIQFLAIATLTLFLAIEAKSYSGFSYCDPDSLELITVTGTVAIDVSGNQLLYFLDVNNDDSSDYRLNFGPFWYLSSDTTLSRPLNGATVTIYGGLNLTAPVLPVIFVYEINGEFWRNPYEPFWNNFNDNYAGNRMHGPHNTAPGWLQDSLIWNTISGVVLSDSTFIYIHYYLDIDGDDLPDFKLNFGPPWYEPTSGQTRPSDGEMIEVYGILIPQSPQNAFIVFELNGALWKEVSGFDINSFGRWMNGNMNRAMTTNDPFNFQNRLMFQDGWHGQGLPPNIYCQILQVHFQNFPNYQEQNAFAGFEVGCFSQMGMGPVNNLMMQNGQKLRFNHEASLQLHINQSQIQRASIQQRDRIRLKYWNDDTESWETAAAQIDPSTDLITFTSSTQYAYYILTVEEETTSTTDVVALQDLNLHLFPNPVADCLFVEFYLKKPRPVYLSLYDNYGREVQRVINRVLMEGYHKIEIRISDKIHDGIYHLRLQSAGLIDTRTIQIYE